MASDTLRTRIAAVLRLHQWRATVRTSDNDPVLDCCCGIAFGGALDCQRGAFDSYREHVADAVIRELTPILLDFGEWLAEEVGFRRTPVDLQSCLEDWRGD